LEGMGRSFGATRPEHASPETLFPTTSPQRWRPNTMRVWRGSIKVVPGMTWCNGGEAVVCHATLPAVTPSTLLIKPDISPNISLTSAHSSVDLHRCHPTRSVLALPSITFCIEWFSHQSSSCGHACSDSPPVTGTCLTQPAICVVTPGPRYTTPARSPPLILLAYGPPDGLLRRLKVSATIEQCACLPEFTSPAPATPSTFDRMRVLVISRLSPMSGQPSHSPHNL